MTREAAIRKIQESDCDYFHVQCLRTDRSCCDLCHEETEREFTISAKHIGGDYKKKGYVLDNGGSQRVTRHICVDCFVRLFPDSVIEEER